MGSPKGLLKAKERLGLTKGHQKNSHFTGDNIEKDDKDLGGVIRTGKHQNEKVIHKNGKTPQDIKQKVLEKELNELTVERIEMKEHQKEI